MNNHNCLKERFLLSVYWFIPFWRRATVFFPDSSPCLFRWNNVPHNIFPREFLSSPLSIFTSDDVLLLWCDCTCASFLDSISMFSWSMNPPPSHARLIRTNTFVSLYGMCLNFLWTWTCWQWTCIFGSVLSCWTAHGLTYLLKSPYISFASYSSLDWHYIYEICPYFK